MSDEKTYFRTGLGLKKAVLPILEGEYHSQVVDRLRERGYRASTGGVTIRLAEEFGYCYGVDRAVQYAYEARHKFPERRLLLVGEIIHNPHVNARLRELGIELLMPLEDGSFDFSELFRATSGHDIIHTIEAKSADDVLLSMERLKEFGV